MNKIIIKDTEWPSKAAAIIADQIRNVLLTKNYCSVFLTGGQGAQRIYTFLKAQLKTIPGEINFFLGDERCVSDNHIDSNFRMIVQTLFSDGICNSQKLYKMYNESDTPEEAARKYERILPVKPDIIILGLGDDGHIASLFPGQPWIKENTRSVIISYSPINGQPRVTITKKYIQSGNQILVLASGIRKSRVLNELSDKIYNAEIPGSIAISGLWLIDESANQ